MRCNALPLGLTMPYALTCYVLAARFRTASNSNTLADGLAKNRAAREYNGVSLLALTHE